LTYAQRLGELEPENPEAHRMLEELNTIRLTDSVVHNFRDRLGTGIVL